MNFEVGEGKVYKGASCQSLGSNWERIESFFPGLIEEMKYWYSAATGKELKDFHQPVDPSDQFCGHGSNWERIERSR